MAKIAKGLGVSIMDDSLKKFIYECSGKSPGLWLLSAMSLKGAADKLDIIRGLLKPEKYDCFIREYQLLIGLSFENLLKGIIVLERLKRKQKPSFPKDCSGSKGHNLKFLAEKNECSILKLSENDILILSKLTPYIVWAGRYPFPKKEEDLIVISYGSTEYSAEINLWDRISSCLKKEGWVMKGNSRLYFDKSKNI